VTISISYSVANTTDSVNDAIAREIHEIKTLEHGTKEKRTQLRAFIKENIGAVNVEEIKATLKANGYVRQRIHDILKEFGIVPKAIKKSGASTALQKEVMAELAILQKKHNDRKKLKALLIRMYRAL
jgi:hypothetical protein